MPTKEPQESGAGAGADLGSAIETASGTKIERRIAKVAMATGRATGTTGASDGIVTAVAVLGVAETTAAGVLRDRVAIAAALGSDQLATAIVINRGRAQTSVVKDETGIAVSLARAQVTELVLRKRIVMRMPNRKTKTGGMSTQMMRTSVKAGIIVTGIATATATGKGTRIDAVTEAEPEAHRAAGTEADPRTVRTAATATVTVTGTGTAIAIASGMRTRIVTATGTRIVGSAVAHESVIQTAVAGVTLVKRPATMARALADVPSSRMSASTTTRTGVSTKLNTASSLPNSGRQSRRPRRSRPSQPPGPHKHLPIRGAPV